MSYDEYRGMSYEQASHEAERLIKTYGWYNSWDRLSFLRGVMITAAARNGTLRTTLPRGTWARPKFCG